jgi:hypothetical protein
VLYDILCKMYRSRSRQKGQADHMIQIIATSPSVTSLRGSSIMRNASVAEDSIFATCLAKLAFLVHFSVMGQFAGDLTNVLAIWQVAYSENLIYFLSLADDFVPEAGFAHGHVTLATNSNTA